MLEVPRKDLSYLTKIYLVLIPAMPRKKYRETAVEWTWRGDKNDWVIYDKETAALLEEEFTKGSKKVKVDKERFVDFSLSNADIIKNFNVS